MTWMVGTELLIVDTHSTGIQSVHAIVVEHCSSPKNPMVGLSNLLWSRGPPWIIIILLLTLSSWLVALLHHMVLVGQKTDLFPSLM